MSEIKDFLDSKNIKIIDKIGQGGFKQVFLADVNGTQEALKITKLFDENELDPDKQDNIKKELFARSHREVDLIKKLGGGNIVSLGSIDETIIGKDNHNYFIYSEEFIPGKTLDKVILSNGTALPSFEQVNEFFAIGLDVLQKFEANKIIHRDIKPSNIMVAENASRPYVFFDLGIAYDQQSTSLTSGKYGPGTLRYRAPETLDPNYRSLLDSRSDLFSFAATTFEYATGEHPIHPSGATPGETIYRLSKVNATPLFYKRSDFPQKFCDLIDHCLKRRPALRPKIINAQKILENL